MLWPKIEPAVRMLRFPAGPAHGCGGPWDGMHAGTAWGVLCTFWDNKHLINNPGPSSKTPT